MRDRGVWVKASKSGANGQCVELRAPGDAVEVRDTKQVGLGPTLKVSAAAFGAWLAGAKSGELDPLV